MNFKLFNKKFSSLSIGLVGYPNVGKSTFFNALVKRQLAEARNQPFCTISPNISTIGIEDENMLELAKITNIKDLKPYSVEVKDVAGLIKGSAEGKGAGNQFLNCLRTCNALVQVLRCFKNKEIDYMDSELDPLNEIQVVQTELLLSDLEIVEKKIEHNKKLKKDEKEFLNFFHSEMNKGKMPKEINIPQQYSILVNSLNLITNKPLLYVLNIEPPEIENELTKAVFETGKINRNDCITTSVLLENEACMLTEEDNSLWENRCLIDEFVDSYGIKYQSLKLFEKVVEKLNYNVFYTLYGGNIISSYLVNKGDNILDAASKIHSDFSKNFVCAEISKLSDWQIHKDEEMLKKNNKLIRVNREYIMKEYDIVKIRAS